MNAEFTEKKIVITEVGGNPVITPAQVRKGLDANAFIGAMIVSSYGCDMVTGALIVDDTIELLSTETHGYGPIDYTPATGVLKFRDHP